MRHSLRPIALGLVQVGSLLGLSLAVACSSANDGESVGGGGGGGSSGGGGSGAPPSVYPPSSTPVEATDEGIAKLNEYRALAGLPTVAVDMGTPSVGCANHLDYLIWEHENNNRPRCFLSHTEDNHDNPFYSPENETAGKNSVISCGYGTGDQSLGMAVDLWINSLYHRLPLIDTGLETIGYASKAGYNCINYRGGTKPTELEVPVLWPPDNMSDVPRSFAGFEAPCPTKTDNPLATNGMDCPGSGYLITASWFNWGNEYVSIFKNSSPTARLVDAASGAEIPLLVWYADRLGGHDPAPKYTLDTLTLIPEASLPPNTQLRVEFDGTINGEATSLRWSFATGTRDQ